jgi:hypothetical protein
MSSTITHTITHDPPVAVVRNDPDNAWVIIWIGLVFFLFISIALLGTCGYEYYYSPYDPVLRSYPSGTAVLVRTRDVSSSKRVEPAPSDKV